MNIFTLDTKGIIPKFCKHSKIFLNLPRGQEAPLAVQRPFRKKPLWLLAPVIAVILSSCTLFSPLSKTGEEIIALPSSTKILAVDSQGFLLTSLRVRSEDRPDILLKWKINTSTPILKEKAEPVLSSARIEEREEGGLVYRIRALSFKQGKEKIDLECFLDLIVPTGLGLGVAGNQIDIEGGFRLIESKGGETKIILRERAESLRAEAISSPLTVEGDADQVFLRTIAPFSFFPENVDVSLKTTLKGKTYYINSMGSIDLLVPQDATGFLNAPQGTKIGIPFVALSSAEAGRVMGYLNGSDGRIINLEAGKEAALIPFP